MSHSGSTTAASAAAPDVAPDAAPGAAPDAARATAPDMECANGLIVEQDGAVLSVTLDRPAKKNAFTSAMYARLADALERLSSDDELRCLVVRATGGCFSAGNDLNDFLTLDSFDADTPVVRVLNALGRGDKPMLAAVDGAAIGIGTTLLLHCDLVFATPSAQFGAPFVPLGLVPEAGSSRLLVELIGYRRAMAMFLLGERLDAAAAESSGLINACVAPEMLDETVMTAARRIAALPVEAVRQTRRLCRAEPVSIAATIERENACFAERLDSPEARAAIEAVLGGRR